MGFLLSRDADISPSPSSSNQEDSWQPPTESKPIVWRGLMVQKATQQLLFQVDWSGNSSVPGGIDILVIDMPPGTGDVALTLGQLVRVDGAVIVSTAQDVALADVKKGVGMFQAVNVPMLGMVLNMAHYVCPNCTTAHDLFGPSTAIDYYASQMGLPILGKLPLVSQLSWSADRGVPLVLSGAYDGVKDKGVEEIVRVMDELARGVMKAIE